MKNQTVILITSIAIILGFALLFLGAMTYLDATDSIYAIYEHRIEARSRAYIEMAIGFIFIAIGVVIYFLYGKSETTRN